MTRKNNKLKGNTKFGIYFNFENIYGRVALLTISQLTLSCYIIETKR